MRVKNAFRRGQVEAGVTIIELSIALAIFALIGGLAMSALMSATTAVGYADDESRGLAELRTVSERLARDLRAARGVNASATANKLTLWIDYDSNYRQVDSETITWKITGTAPRFSVERVVGPVAGPPITRQIVGGALVSDIAFSYLPALPASRVVRVEMSYDAVPGLYSSQRLVKFDVRMRNVE